MVGCSSTPAGGPAGVEEPVASGGGNLASPETAARQAELLPPAGTSGDSRDSGTGSGGTVISGPAQASPSPSKPPDRGPVARVSRTAKRPGPVASAPAAKQETVTRPDPASASEIHAEEPAAEPAPPAGADEEGRGESVAEVTDPGGVETAALVVPPSVVPPNVLPPGVSPPASPPGGGEPSAGTVPLDPVEPWSPAAPDLPSVPTEPSSVLPAGTVLEVRLAERLSTESHRTGDRFLAILDRDVELSDGAVIPRGTMLEGEVTEAVAPGKVKGKARLSITLERLTIQGRELELRTNEISLEAEGSAREDLKQVGIAAAVGTALGAIFGGKKGAAVGAAAGAGAGTARVLTTEGDHVEVPRERLFSFRLEEAVELAGG